MNKNKLVKPYFILIITMTSLTSILLTMSFVFSFDSETGFFEANSVYSTIFSVLYTLGILLCLVSIFLFSKKLLIKSDNTFNNTAKSVFALLGTALILVGTLSYFFATENYSFDTISYILSIGIYAFGGYLLLFATKNGYKFSIFKLLCLLLSIAFPIGIHLVNNSDLAKPLRTPDNELTAVFCVGFLIYVLYEGRRVHSGQHHRMHFASMLLTFFTGFTISSAYIVAFAVGTVNDTARFYQTIAILIISIAVFVETLIFTKRAVAHTEEEWAEIEAAQEQAQEENQPTVEGNAEEIAEENQIDDISIEDIEEQNKTDE